MTIMRKILSALSRWCRATVSVLPVVAILAFTACDEKNEVAIPATLDIPEESLQFFEYGISFSATSSGDVLTVKLSFTSSLSWSVTIEDPKDGKPITWLTVNPSSGNSGPNEITVTAQDNISEQPRSAKITITCGSISKSINVVQFGQKSSGGLVVSPAQVTLVKQEKTQLTAFDTDGKPVTATWSSSNDMIAAVDPSGQVEGHNPGTAIITAQADGKSGTCQVTVEDDIPVQSLTFDKTELSLNVGETYTLTPIFTPENATNQTIYRWASTAPAIATVDDNGLVTAVAPGKALIRAGLDPQGTIMAECEVTVIDPNAVVVESVTLDITQATIGIKQANPLILTATVTPENALDNSSIEWKSSNPDIVKAESLNKTQGKVFGVAAGKATVMAYINGKYAECEVTVEGGSSSLSDPAPDGSVNLGLSVYWATSNLSQTGLCANPYDYGDYYAWGETEPHYSSLEPKTWKEGTTGYYTSTYKWIYNGNKQKITKYCGNSPYWAGSGEMDNKTVLDPEDDAAHVILGNKWHTPTEAEWQELVDNCTWSWTDSYQESGISGMIVTSNKTGFKDRSIFFPTSGDFYGTDLAVAGSAGWYWTSTCFADLPSSASCGYVHYGNLSVNAHDRYFGFTIRPVTE